MENEIDRSAYHYLATQNAAQRCRTLFARRAWNSCPAIDAGEMVLHAFGWPFSSYFGSYPALSARVA